MWLRSSLSNEVTHVIHNVVTYLYHPNYVVGTNILNLVVWLSPEAIQSLSLLLIVCSMQYMIL